MAHYNLRSDTVMDSHPPSGEGHPFGSNPPDIVKILSDDLLNDVSQISEQCEPVCKRKGKTLYKYGTSGTTRTLLMTATALDPSFFRMKKYRINEYTQSLKETMLKITKNMDNSHEESQSSIKEASTPASTNKNSTSKASTTLNLYSSDSEDDESSQTNSNTIVSNVEEELKDYKAYVMNQNEYIKYKIDNGDWSLSAFWKAHESRFKYLSETVKAITFLKDNYKYFPKDVTETDSQATSDDDPENDSEADSEED